MCFKGELFYVETDDVHNEDLLASTRHDHGHLGGVSLETITAARFAGQPAAKKGPSSIESRETAATSRSSSQDTQENDNNAWQQRPQRGPQDLGQRIMASNPEPFLHGHHDSGANRRVSLREAQEWDFHKKLEDIEASERRDRQRSCSEPQLSSMRAGARHQQKQQQQRDLHLRRPQPYQQRWDTVNEGCSSAGWKMPTSMPSPPSPIRGNLDACGGGDPCADACAGLTAGLQQLWSSVSSVFGQQGEEEEEQAHTVGTLRSRSRSRSTPRVNSITRNFASCTSTKTFESSPTYREVLQRLGVDPETSTFTMHIAGYR